MTRVEKNKRNIKIVELLNNNTSVNDICKYYNLSGSAIRQIAKTNGLNLKTLVNRLNHDEVLNRIRELRSIKNTANHYKISEETVRKICKLNGFSLTLYKKEFAKQLLKKIGKKISLKDSNFLKNQLNINYNQLKKEELKDVILKYYKRGISRTKIAILLERDLTTITRYLTISGIPKQRISKQELKIRDLDIFNEYNKIGSVSKTARKFDMSHTNTRYCILRHLYGDPRAKKSLKQKHE